MQLSRIYASLPEQFSAPLTPTPLRNPQIVALNEPLARELGLDPDWLRSPAGLAFLGHGSRPDGTSPVAMAYAGHQFGHFVPSLGDGRAMLVGEVTDRARRLRDIHLKGSGPTPFSRRGDGRAALGPVLREYVVSEAMHALGIPTTRALAALTTGESVMRETMQPGGVIVRIASSHVRVGTFQYFAAQGDTQSVRILADHVIGRLYPELSDTENPYLALLEAVTARQAKLVARWMLVGFIHGVMNTDNMSIAGETIDFGPCAFLDAYDPAKVFSFIDQNGRYAYGNQPDMALWNLGRLAETLLPLLDTNHERAVEQAKSALMRFDVVFNEAYLGGWRRKLGLALEEDGDARLAGRLLTAMHRGEADFTLTFRRLGDVVRGGQTGEVMSLFGPGSKIEDWIGDWQARLDREERSAEACHADMQATNPRIIPRNHRIEEMIRSAVAGDYAPFHRLTEALSHPFEDRTDGFEAPPTAHEQVKNTFCGT
ncbi:MULTISPECIES: protein adenylyltransferase SelO [Gluconobacter]|uniref:Protein nucleotidyltransferase YdiU n=1 Tax=Gluconobacter cadivus TaxID=2728101 RepID=A0ABR9YRZ0_9PROT|nr:MULTISPECIES: YdiU family protein [Gluconobacter]MBF0887281.1 YdiU family protein [Gluconobacter cadivus]MBS1059350.1 YdiU family protein [Gluconobacter sp. Dm-44]